MAFPIRCYECGADLGSIKDAFLQMRQIRLQSDPNISNVHILNRTIDTRQEVDMQILFKELHVDNTCCRSHLTSFINPQEMKYKKTFMDTVSPVEPEVQDESSE